MCVEKRDFGNAVDINCPAIIDVVSCYDGGPCAALAVKEDIGMLSQSEVGGEEHLLTEVRGDESEKQK